MFPPANQIKASPEIAKMHPTELANETKQTNKIIKTQNTTVYVASYMSTEHKKSDPIATKQTAKIKEGHWSSY